jgi:hypothetical protein
MDISNQIEKSIEKMLIELIDENNTLNEKIIKLKTQNTNEI